MPNIKRILKLSCLYTSLRYFSTINGHSFSFHTNVFLCTQNSESSNCCNNISYTCKLLVVTLMQTFCSFSNFIHHRIQSTFQNWKAYLHTFPAVASLLMHTLNFRTCKLQHFTRFTNCGCQNIRLCRKQSSSLARIKPVC